MRSVNFGRELHIKIKPKIRPPRKANARQVGSTIASQLNQWTLQHFKGQHAIQSVRFRRTVFCIFFRTFLHRKLCSVWRAYGQERIQQICAKYAGNSSENKAQPSILILKHIPPNSHSLVVEALQRKYDRQRFCLHRRSNGGVTTTYACIYNYYYSIYMYKASQNQ